MRDRRNPLKENLSREIHSHHALKVAWNQSPVDHGYIKIINRRCVKRCPNNLNMDLPIYSVHCDGKSCTRNHSFIWGMYTLVNRENGKIGQYHIFMGHCFPEAFRRLNESLANVDRIKTINIEHYM